MRIVVDLNRCVGYAQCVPLAPDVLRLQGEEALAYDPNPDDSQRQRVARAANTSTKPNRRSASSIFPPIRSSLLNKSVRKCRTAMLR